MKHGQPTRRPWPPVVYGHPDWIETYLQSVAKVLNCQPQQVFANDRVRQAGNDLAALIDQYVSDHDPDDDKQCRMRDGTKQPSGPPD